MILAFWLVFFLVGAVTTSYVYSFISAAPYVPSHPEKIDEMLQVAGIRSGCKVYDLGCGDGRLVFATADRGANAVGYEITFHMWMIAMLRKIFLGKRGEIILGDFWDKDFSDADIIFCFLLPKAMVDLRQKFEKELKPGCRVISHKFPIPGWNPKVHLPDENKFGRGEIWIYER